MRGTAALVAVFAILAGAVWWFELRGNPGGAQATPQGQAPVFDLKLEDVARVEVVDGPTTIAVERNGDGAWRLVQPPSEDADLRRIDAAVGQVAKLNANRKLEDATDLASYGLVNPPTHLLLKMKDGSSQELLVGSKTPDSASYYVKRGDSPAIFVASTFALSDLMRWPVDPPKPRPTPTPLPLTPVTPPAPATKPAG
jgi:hypothetical protein